MLRRPEIVIALLYTFAAPAGANSGEHEHDVRILLEALRKYAPPSEVAAAKAQLSASLRTLRKRKRIAAEYVEQNTRLGNVGDDTEEALEAPKRNQMILCQFFLLLFFCSWIVCMWTIATDAINYKCLRERYGWNL